TILNSLLASLTSLFSSTSETSLVLLSLFASIFLIKVIYVLGSLSISLSTWSLNGVLDGVFSISEQPTIKQKVIQFRAANINFLDMLDLQFFSTSISI